jgi:hypothetical protein
MHYRLTRLGRTSVSAAAFLAAAILLLPVSGVAGGIKLDSREYKLMLDPTKFAGAEPRQAVDQFTHEQLVPAMRKEWTDDAADTLRESRLEIGEHRGEHRIVRFWDDRDCLLSRHGFAWRERVDATADGGESDEVELTLKFRSPDVFLAAGTSLTARQHAKNDDTKFEEDLGPLAVRSGRGEGVAANPRGARSQFSRSTKQIVPGNEVPTSLTGIAGLYPSFEEELRTVAGHVAMSAPLEASSKYRELVYKSAKLKLAKDLKAKFALTLWYEGVENHDRPALAEISFKYDVTNGEVPTEAAGRALALLLAMQDLPWADPTAPTKTALVACGGVN